MEVLHQQQTEKYLLHEKFVDQAFGPIGAYVNWKLTSAAWDDYNELYHAFQYVATLKQQPGIWFETHTIERGTTVIGVLFVVGGKIDQLEPNLQTDPSDTLLLKYFHITEKGKGYGSFWLQSVVFPHYVAKGFRYLHVNSSHEKSFAFYNRLGTFIGNYERKSDNGRYTRTGSSYLIRMG